MLSCCISWPGNNINEAFKACKYEQINVLSLIQKNIISFGSGFKEIRFISEEQIRCQSKRSLKRTELDQPSTKQPESTILICRSLTTKWLMLCILYLLVISLSQQVGNYIHPFQCLGEIRGFIQNFENNMGMHRFSLFTPLFELYLVQAMVLSKGSSSPSSGS